MSETNQFGQPVGDLLPGWHPRPHPERVTLEGERCRLEPLAIEHAQALYEAYRLAEDGRSWTWLPREADTSPETYLSWVESVITLQDPIHFAVINKQTQKPVGSLSLMRIDPANGVVEVGYVNFSPLMSRTPLSTEAHWLLMRYVFDTLGYRRYEWKCDSLNEPSRKAALRLGFKYEGRFRQAVVVKGRNRDTDWFSIIDGEWPKVDSAMRKWLAADNFDSDGKQKTHLESLRK
ncbi:GNAT family N-acetyltransferase [Pluralibacter gergoviae]